jgi:serine/threonine protein kinase
MSAPPRGQSGALASDRLSHHSRTVHTARASAVPPITAAQGEPHFAIQAFLLKIVRLGLLSPTKASSFRRQFGSSLAHDADAEEVGDGLVAAGLLSQYQLDRILAGMSYGLRIGNYKIVDRLGTGGMSVVFRAEHTFLKRQAAIKVVPVHASHLDSTSVDRFYAEMSVLAELNHPNIVIAYDAGKELPQQSGEPDLLYLAMELLPGGDLEDYILDRGPVSIRQACQWIAQAANGLQKAHDSGLVHRDIKPSNLLLTRDQQVKLSDFGLVKQFGTRLTDPGSLLGTIDFMAPEQSENPALVGSAADVYGLGASLFWLLTAQSPYPRLRKMSECLKQLREDEPRHVYDLRPNVPDELDGLVQSMLHRDPTRRPLPITAMRNLRRIEDMLATPRS